MTKCSHGNNAGTFTIEFPANLRQTLALHRSPQAVLVFGVEQQKTAAAGPDELATESSVPACEFVTLIDGGIGNSSGAGSFPLPVDMQKFGEPVEIAGFKSILALISDLLCEMQVVDHHLIPSAGPGILILQNS